MTYGWIGSFVRLAFARTAFDYMEKEAPGIDIASYKKRVLREYRAIVERTPGVASTKRCVDYLPFHCKPVLRRSSPESQPTAWYCSLYSRSA